MYWGQGEAFTNNWATISLEGPKQQNHKVPKIYQSWSTCPELVCNKATRLWSPCCFLCLPRHMALPRTKGSQSAGSRWLVRIVWS